MKRLILPALLCLPLLASARPAYPGITTLKNADGTTIQVRGFGDEHFSYLTDTNCETVLERNSEGNYVPAVRLGRVLRPIDTDLRILQAEATPMVAERDKQLHRMADLNSEGRSTYPTCSEEEIPALVILVEFTDTKFTVPDVRNAYDRMLNQEGYSDYGGKGSARDYYLASSNGKFKVHFDVSEVVPLSFPRMHIHGMTSATDTPDKHRYMGDLIKEAIEYLDARGLDFSKYDLDGNGDIDNIFFYYAGYGQADSKDPTTIWPHQGSYMNSVWNYPNEYQEIIVDGVRMRTYACSNELNYTKEQQPWLDGIGAFCHEYGHVLGLPDLYDTRGSNTKTPGRYSIMDTGSYNDSSTCPPRFSSYEQWLCNWVEVEDIEEGKEYTLPSMSVSKDPKIYRMRIRRNAPAGVVRYWNEYFLFESRHHEGWDSTLPEEGLFIWRVNFEQSSYWGSNVVNSMGTPCVELMNSGTTTHAWPGVGNSMYSCPGFNQLTYTNVDFFNKTLPMYFTGIGFDADKKESTFAYNVVTESPDDVTVLHDKPNLTSDDGTQEFLITWDPVEGAEGYYINLSRRSSLGSATTIYNEHFVKDNFIKVKVEGSTAWRQTFTASVRVLKGVPSTKLSNSITFKPTELTYSAVDGIEADNVEIYGGVGEIIAPVESEIYNLSGMRTAANNLPSGIYIVRYAGKAVKVVVR